MSSPVFNWVPKSRKESTITKIVRGIYVACDSPQNAVSASEITDTTLLTNHWVLLLLVTSTTTNDATSRANGGRINGGDGNGLSMVRVSPSPNPSKNMDLDLQIQILQDLDEKEDTHAKKIWLDVTPEKTVGDLLDLLENERFHRFRFAENGTGCRYWVHCTLAKLEEVGYLLDREQCQEAMRAIETVWRDGVEVDVRQRTGIRYFEGSKFV